VKRLFGVAIAAAGLLAAAALAAGLWIHLQLSTPYLGATGAETYVEIPRGAGARRVARLLADAGVLRSRLPFLLYLRRTGAEGRIRAGEYRFDAPATPREIARRLATGDVHFRSITIPEGLTAEETIALLAENGFGTLPELRRALGRTEWIRDLAPEARNLEGYLYPETYRFDRSADAEAVILKMTGQFRSAVSRIVQERPLPEGWDIPRIVTLASMIEKEVKTREEGPLVASVLVNRLDRGMTLGCDATIIYAMKIAGNWEGRLGKADLRMDSPYNSYLHRGLPPGPICCPGASSLAAALRPAATDYLYYVSRNDGTHQFSKDYATHRSAVYRYQQAPFRKRN